MRSCFIFPSRRKLACFYSVAWWLAHFLTHREKNVFSSRMSPPGSRQHKPSLFCPVHRPCTWKECCIFKKWFWLLEIGSQCFESYLKLQWFSCVDFQGTVQWNTIAKSDIEFIENTQNIRDLETGLPCRGTINQMHSTLAPKEGWRTNLLLALYGRKVLN